MLPVFNKKEEMEERGTHGIQTLIGRDTEGKGKLQSKGAVRIDGKFEGEIESASEVVVGEKGVLLADVKADLLILGGKLEGNVTIGTKLEILSTGKLFGDVKTKTLIVEEGALLKGQCEMTGGDTSGTKDEKVQIIKEVEREEKKEKEK